MNAVAISNNDMVYLHWHVAEKIIGCLGFSIVRNDVQSKTKDILPAMVGFSSDKPAGKRFKNTSEWPIQKYAWKDLFAKRGGKYWYEIVPMIGTPGNLTPDTARSMRTNTITLSSSLGSCSVFFNRGIISTQAIARSLPKSSSGLPNVKVIEKLIRNAKSPIRAKLVGDLERGVLTLLDRAKQNGGECYCALYELSDDTLLNHLTHLGKRLHLVLSNAGEDTEKGSKDGDMTNHEVRRELHELELDVSDRMFKKGHIGHNKFIVYVEKSIPKAVLSGSTNWTPTGLCAQSNNAIIIESPGLAKEYLANWKLIKSDTENANGDSSHLQGLQMRGQNYKIKSFHELTDNAGKPSGNVHVWFSPNTRQKSVPKNNKTTPPDLSELFSLMENAKQGILFLAFIPGNPSIVSKLKEIYEEKRKKHLLFYLRGAATSPDPANAFRVDLYHRSNRSDATVRAVAEPKGAAKASARVSSVAGIFATFAQWEAEIYKVGHAVIHDKLLVIDPFTDDSVVVTGSHNLGFRASYANDENMVIIRNNRPVAEAYAAHILDIYEHYRWRWNLQKPIRDAFEKLKTQNPNADTSELWKRAVKTAGLTVMKKGWQRLRSDDKWQDFYQENKDFLAAETNFWSPFSGEAIAKGRPKDPVN